MHRRPALAALLAATAAAPAPAQREWVRFDGAVQTSPGLTFEFGRNAPAYDPAGRLLGPDEPRWVPPTLFCGLPAHETLALGLSTNAIAAGLHADGATPVYVVNTPTHAHMSVHAGPGSVERAFRDGDWSETYALNYRDTGKQNAANLLFGQRGLNGGTIESPTKAFAPTNGGAVHRGLIVLGSDVYENIGGAWTSSRAGLLYTTTDRLGAADPWIVAAMGVATDPADTGRGSPWSLSAFPVSDDELVVVWTDYRSTAKTGGICYATRFLRDGADWTAETIRVARSESPVVTLHWHTGGFIRHPDGRETILVSTGDGVGDNFMLASTLAAGGAWSNGAAVPDTGVDIRSEVHWPSDDWTDPETVWGGTGFSPPRRHNQAISMIPADEANSAILCGTDETSAAVLRLTYDPDTRTPAWTTLYLPSVTGWPGDGVLNFSMQGVPGGPYLGRIDAAGTSDWQSNQRETRILFSPDGLSWGQCYVAGVAGSRQAVIGGDAAYIGSGPTDGAGFRRIGLPHHRLVRPLAVAPSTDNLMRRDIPVPTDRVDPGVAISRLAGVGDLPVGVPPPPCDPSNMFLVENTSTTGRLGMWRPLPGTAAPPPTGHVLLRAWCYALGPEAPEHPRTTVQLAARLGDPDLEHVSLWTGRADFDSGAWLPLAIWSPWRRTIGIGDPFTPDQRWVPEVFLRVEKNTSRWAEERFLIAWEGLYLDAPTVQGNGLPAQTPGAQESALVHGLDLGDEWTVMLVGMLPDDQWDNRSGGSGPPGQRTNSDHRPTLFTLIDSATGHWCRFDADVPREGVMAAIDAGAGTRDVRQSRVVYWLRGSPFTAIVRARDGETTIDYSLGGSLPLRTRLAGAISPDTLRLGPDAFWWHGVETLPYAISDERAAVAFAELALSCRADFNRDDTVDSRDVIAYLNAWTAQRPEADLNADGRVDTLDLVAFLDAYSQGC